MILFLILSRTSVSNIFMSYRNNSSRLIDKNDNSLMPIYVVIVGNEFCFNLEK